jgi:hypothetical protein
MSFLFAWCIDGLFICFFPILLPIAVDYCINKRHFWVIWDDLFHYCVGVSETEPYRILAEVFLSGVYH